MRYQKFVISKFFGHVQTRRITPNQNEMIIASIDVSLYVKRIRQSINSFQRRWQFVILEHFGHAWSFAAKPIQNYMNIFSFHRCLNTCKNWTQSLELFLEVLEFKESCSLIYSFFNGYSPPLFFPYPFLVKHPLFWNISNSFIKDQIPLSSKHFLVILTVQTTF